VEIEKPKAERKTKNLTSAEARKCNEQRARKIFCNIFPKFADFANPNP
jgi:hypothetical protein